MFLGQFVVGTAGALTHHNLDAGITQILGMGMALAAITNDGNGLVFQTIKVCILIVINFHLNIL